ncbi:hypothetical protein OPV22_006418 [Ensete ventricosum]|uniref:Clp R domain-containing protein n=1 Tax=Ensete ventricosum TaxID=4639 RepID=A0AAV8RLB3_ENSVE|nr:hypothetical protein OPV22_006418 [Ensete ventricosum]
MRTGACTLQQALTAEAASVLKHSLSLARRRGHAQVTPLHVAATLLSCSSSSNLLRRACLKSQPHYPASHPLRCRALELCFNVALNRLTTTPPPAAHPSLSNALVAALKRAQAHQRRGCMELQQQQQQLLLAVKIELEQLIISILDDPSVSRVMREAGFSSTSVKSSLEEETSSVLSRSSSFLLESHKDVIDHGSSFWQSPLFTLPSQQSSHDDDASAVFAVMLGKQGRRTNTVLVGDSVSMAEGVVAELMAKVGRGEVPDELKAAHFIKLHLSYVHLRLMSRSDADLKLSDLRRKIDHLASERTGGGVIIYAGDLRWTVDEETRDGCRFKPAEHMVAELGRLLSEFRSSIGNGGAGAANTKLWLLATASYQTYTRCQVRQPSLETRWALQAVVVPSGGLGLSLQAPSGRHSGSPQLFQHPSPLLGSKVLSYREDEKLICCGECISNFEREASVHRSVNKDTSCGSTQLPFWLQRQSPDDHKDALVELKRKWNSLCRNLHHIRRSQTHLHPSSTLNQSCIGKNLTCSSSYPWWPNSNQSKNSMRTTPELDGGLPFDMVDSRNGTGNWQEREESKPNFSEVSLRSLRSAGTLDVGVTLSLGSAAVSDSATSNKQKEMMADHRELTRKLLENMPWQSEIVPSIVEALTSSENKGVRLLLQGNDCVSKRRLARVVVEHFCGSEERFIHINMRRRASKCSSCGEILEEAWEKESKLVVFMEAIDRADTSFIRSLVDVLKMGAFETSSGQEVCLTETTFILTTSSSAGIGDAGEGSNDVIKMKLEAEEPSTNKDLKRKEAETEQQDKPKRPRTGGCTLDLNLLAEGEDEEAVPSDLTNETDCGNSRLPSELLELITARFAMDADLERLRPASENLVSKLRRAFDEVRSGGGEEIGELLIDGAAVAELMAAAGSFLEGIFERWVREVFQTCLRRVERGGNVRLRAEGKVGNVAEFGFMSSLLPKRMEAD